MPSQFISLRQPFLPCLLDCRPDLCHLVWLFYHCRLQAHGLLLPNCLDAARSSRRLWLFNSDGEHFAVPAGKNKALQLNGLLAFLPAGAFPPLGKMKSNSESESLQCLTGCSPELQLASGSTFTNNRRKMQPKPCHSIERTEPRTILM